MGFLNILTGPIRGLVEGVSGIIGQFVTTDKEKMAAQAVLLDLQTKFNQALLEADAKFAEQQASVITSEIKSESWLARNWRPILMLTFTFIIFWNYVIIPIFGAFTQALQPAVLVPQMWELLKLGVSGYIVGRSGEKIVESWAATKK